MVRIMLPTGKAVELGVARGSHVVVGDRADDPLFVPDVEFFTYDEDAAFSTVRRLKEQYPEVAWFVMRVQP